MSVYSSIVATEGQQNSNLVSWNSSRNDEAENTTNKIETTENRRIEQTTVCCFVCDGHVQGRRYTLATCKTQSSGSRVIEKLGELVGERYVVVISEDDVICRSCANLINTLDRLETEMKVSKAAVLRFLELKYSLAEGELVQDNSTPASIQSSCPPSQIIQTNDYHSRKRGAPVFIGDSETVRKKKKKSTVWMQCDKCRYTTLYDTFMVRHVRRHAERRLNCDKCGIKFPDNGENQETTAHDCPNKENNETTNNFIQSKNRGKDALNTIDPCVAKTTTNLDSIKIEKQNASIEATDTQSDDFRLQTDSSVANGAASSLTSSSNVEEAIFVQVLQEELAVGEASLDGTQSSVLPEEFTNSTDQIDAPIRELNNRNGTTARQMLTLAEDGSLEMVSVDCWNDAAHSRDTDTDIIPF